MDNLEVIKAILMNSNTEIHPDREGNLKVKGINNNNEIELSDSLDKVSKAVDKLK